MALKWICEQISVAQTSLKQLQMIHFEASYVKIFVSATGISLEGKNKLLYYNSITAVSELVLLHFNSCINYKLVRLQEPIVQWHASGSNISQKHYRFWGKPDILHMHNTLCQILKQILKGSTRWHGLSK